MSEPNESRPPGEPVRDPAYALPSAFVKTLFAALLGGMVPGIYMTLVSAPGNTGSPVYGMVLPWTVLPFLLSVASAWRARKAPVASKLASRTILAAVLGLVAYSYYMMIHPRGVRNVQVFLWLPLWQWVIMAIPMTQCAFGSVPAPDTKPEDND